MKALHALVLMAAAALPVYAQDMKEKQREVEGTLLRKGALDRLNPENASADPDSVYRNALNGIDIFLRGVDSVDFRETRNRSVDVLLANLFVDNHVSGGIGLNDRVRRILKREGMLNYASQLHELAELSEVAVEQGRRNPEEKRVLKERVERFLLLAERIPEIALASRFQMQVYPEREDKIARIVKSEGYAYRSLIALEKAVKMKDVKGVEKELGVWQRYQQHGFSQLLSLQEDAGGEVRQTLGNWTLINNNGTALIATEDFARDWGQNGENFYGAVARIKKALRSFKEKKRSPVKYVYHLGYGDEISMDELVSGRVPTVLSEAVLPQELDAVLDVGDTFMIQSHKDMTGQYTVVGFSKDGTMYCSGEPGLFLPDNTENFMIRYRPGNYKKGAHFFKIER
jgi:hypothetical protein